jgi:uncharacterized protein DUF3300
MSLIDPERTSAAPPPAGEALILPEYIVIEPAEPDVIYVPIYDPVVIYGVGYWPSGFAPFFWHPPWWTVGPVWGFWPVVNVGPALWCYPNCSSGFVQINVVKFNAFNHANLATASAITKWQHDPAHHIGVPYQNVSLQQKFGNVTAVHEPKPNTNINLKPDTNLNLSPHPNLGVDKQNKPVGVSPPEPLPNVNTGKKDGSGGKDNKNNPPSVSRSNPPSISNVPNVERNIQNLNRGPSGAGDTKVKPGGEQPGRHP